MHMTRHFLSHAAVVLLGLGILPQAHLAFAQDDLNWTGSGDGSTFSDDDNWISDIFGAIGPEFQFTDDSLKLNTTGATITNDLDPADNSGDPLLLNHGTGTSADSGSFHFQAGAGNFTFDGFPVEVGLGNVATSTFIRIDEGVTGTTQTFNMPIEFSGSGNRSRAIRVNNSVLEEGNPIPTTYSEVIFNGDIDMKNDRFLVDEGPARIVINGAVTGAGVSSYSPANTTVTARASVRQDAFASEYVLSNDDALISGGTTGTWAGGDLALIGGIQALSAAFIDTTAPLDLSDNYFHLQSGVGAVLGSINYKSSFDSTIGYVFGTSGNRRLVVSGTGSLTIEHGVFAGGSDAGRVLLLIPTGAGGGDGEIIVNGALHNTLIDPLSWGTNGTTAGGGIATPRNDLSTTITGMDTYAAIRGLAGTIRLNGDSSNSWLSSLYRSENGNTTIVGHDNAFGDANSLVASLGSGTIDIGSHTIQQRFVLTEGTIRGTGSLTNGEDWNISGTVQPGGESPTTADTLTFDFSAASAANTLGFESSSTLDFVLDSAFASSTISVLGASAGTNVFLNDNTIFLTDLSGGSLAEGTYTLIDGDSNTTYTLGSSIGIDGLSGFTGTVSVLGDDLVLDLAVAVGTPGDFNADGLVDAADYTVYRDNLGLATTLPNDAGLGSPVTAAHYTLWTSFYGTGSSTTTSAAVPEPGSLLLLAGAAVVYGLRRRQA